MITHISTTSFTGLGHRLISFHKASIANVIIESLDEIHSCLLRILMWNYQSKVNYLCVKLRVHFRVLVCGGKRLLSNFHQIFIK